MPLDAGAVGQEFGPEPRTWSDRESLLYALAVGAGQRDPAVDLELTTENSDASGIAQRVLPTFATVLGDVGISLPALGQFDPAMLVHGEHALEVYGAIPAAGAITTTTRIAGIHDKSSGTLVVIDSAARLVAAREPLFRQRFGLFVRGAGGTGRSAGAEMTSVVGPPDRPPDAVIVESTRADQALRYRLLGDRNPLHSDPVFVRRAGFERPILHGLCVYGFAARALLRAFCASDPARFRAMQCRFRAPTEPGAVLETRAWAPDAAGVGDPVRFETRTVGGAVVLSAGGFWYA